MIKKLSRTLWLTLCTSLLSCITGFDLSNWPDQIPSPEYFFAAYEADQENAARQTRNEYMSWVVNFYQGSLRYPTGWLEIEERVVVGFADEDKNAARVKIQQLGALIAAEWAKHNDIRLIDTRILALWGSVLQLATDSTQRSAGIELIGLDANGLLSRSLAKSAVTEARYASLLGIDLFDGF